MISVFCLRIKKNETVGNKHFSEMKNKLCLHAETQLDRVSETQKHCAVDCPAKPEVIYQLLIQLGFLPTRKTEQHRSVLVTTELLLKNRI